MKKDCADAATGASGRLCKIDGDLRAACGFAFL